MGFTERAHIKLNQVLRYDGRVEFPKNLDVYYGGQKVATTVVWTQRVQGCRQTVEKQSHVVLVANVLLQC